MNPLELDVLSLVRRLNGCIVFLSLIERESEVVLLHLDVARRMMKDLGARSPRLEQAGKGLVRHMDFLVESRKNLVLRLRNLERRGRIQLQFVGSPWHEFVVYRANFVGVQLYNFLPGENREYGGNEAGDGKVCVSEEVSCRDEEREKEGQI